MMGRWKSFVWLALALAAAAQPALLRAALKPEKIYRKTLPAVMTLQVQNAAGERFIGTAFLALADDVAITAWHVVSDARSVWATFADGERVKVVGCISANAERDLALIKLERRMPNRRASLCTALQSVGARAYVIGSPRGYDFSISDGLVSQIRRVDGVQQYQVSCPISPGNSGGPVLNDRGEVIGVTSWRKTDAQDVSFAIPAREVARLDSTGPLTPWEQFAPSYEVVVASAPTKPANPAGTPVKGEAATGSFNDFKARLEKSAGKTVKVTVQEGEEQNSFTFTVPPSGLH
jgi:S1-C subfamily serine protease